MRIVILVSFYPFDMNLLPQFFMVLSNKRQNVGIQWLTSSFEMTPLQELFDPRNGSLAIDQPSKSASVFYVSRS